jgi:hypothetical protein
MNRFLAFSLAISMSLAIPVRAANKPPVGMKDQRTVWTNEDLETLQTRGLISIVGQPAPAGSTTAHTPPMPYVETQDPEWYAEQAKKLRNDLERRQAELDAYRQAIEDAKTRSELDALEDLARRNDIPPGILRNR